MVATEDARQACQTTIFAATPSTMQNVAITPTKLPPNINRSTDQRCPNTKHQSSKEETQAKPSSDDYHTGTVDSTEGMSPSLPNIKGHQHQEEQVAPWAAA
jgi:hypothetical protein